jgi:hydrogenase maturation protease
MSRTRPISLLVLGLGNRICGDDGLGITAVERLERLYDCPEGVQVLDGGTLGLSLLPYLEDARDVILVDAVRADAPPGTFVHLEGGEVPPAVYERLSPHQIGVSDLLAGADLLGHSPERLVLLGLVPETLDLSLEHSDAVEREIPALVERIVEEAREWGYELVRKGADEAPSLGRRGLAPVAVGL